MMSQRQNPPLTRAEEQALWRTIAGAAPTLSVLSGTAAVAIAAAAWWSGSGEHPLILLVGVAYAVAFALLTPVGRAALRWDSARPILYLYVTLAGSALLALELAIGPGGAASPAIVVLLLGGFGLGLPKPLQDNVALSLILLLCHGTALVLAPGQAGPDPSAAILPLLAAAMFAFLGIGQFQAYRIRIAAVRRADEALRHQKQLEQQIRDRADGLKAHVERRQRRIDRLQEQLIQNEKLASIGELSSCIAHELNNPLTVALGFTEEALSIEQSSPSPSEDVVEALGFVRGAVERMARIVGNLRTFSRRAPSNLQTVQLNEVVETSLLFLKKRFTDGGIEPRTELAPDLPSFQGDPSAIQQVLINLVGNACDALVDSPPPKDGPRVLITTRLVGDEVELSVSDNGPGVPDKMKAAIFGSFFTTKPSGVGTGLGLAICTEIVRRHRGRIGVGDAPTGGARFVVRLPLRHPDLEAGTPGHGVLILDPDAAAGDALAARLAMRGCTPHRVGTAAEARSVLQDRQISLLLTELRVPDARPLSSLIQTVRSTRPDVRIVIVSDPPTNVRIHEILRVTAADGFYQKEPSDADVAEIVERFLFATPDSARSA